MNGALRKWKSEAWLRHEMDDVHGKLRWLLQFAKEFPSVKTPLDDRKYSHLEGFVEYASHPTRIDPVMNLQARERTHRALATLSPREERVLRLRFGVGEPPVYSTDEIGRQLAVSGERIRQIEIAALRKLRRPACKERLEGRLDS